MNNRLMVIGGTLQYGAAIYNQVKDLWYTTAPMNNKRLYSAAVEWNGTVVVTGGFDPVTASVEQFNPKTNQWTALPDLQVARYNHALVNINNCLYAIGGYNGQVILSSVERYNAASMLWQIVFTLLTARHAFACAKLKVSETLSHLCVESVKS